MDIFNLISWGTQHITHVTREGRLPSLGVNLSHIVPRVQFNSACNQHGGRVGPCSPFSPSSHRAPAQLPFMTWLGKRVERMAEGRALPGFGRPMLMSRPSQTKLSSVNYRYRHTFGWICVLITRLFLKRVPCYMHICQGGACDSCACNEESLKCWHRSFLVRSPITQVKTSHLGILSYMVIGVV